MNYGSGAHNESCYEAGAVTGKEGSVHRPQHSNTATAVLRSQSERVLYTDPNTLT